jgi:5'-deoxynucleotidase YfbR-like HD superfamily hydrolase
MYDVGYALSQVPRFGGHTVRRWTVLHHLLAAWYYAKEKYDARVALHALLHDAHEAVTSDIPQPWKTDDMRKIQQELDARIYHSLKLRPPDGFTARIIHQIDNQLVYSEAKDFAPQVAAAILQPGDNFRDGINTTDHVAEDAVGWAEYVLYDYDPVACGATYTDMVQDAIKEAEK